MSLIILSSNFLFALSIDEAVQIALEKNYDIEEQSAIYEQSKKVHDISKSNFSPKVDLSYMYNNRDKTILGQSKEDSIASSVISYNLFNGLKDLQAFDRTRFNSISNKFLLKAKKEDIILNTQIAFIDYLNKKKSLKTFELAYRLFDKQYLDAQMKFKQGLLAKNDVLQIHVNLLNAEQNVLISQKEVKVSKFVLSNILGGYDLKNEVIKEFSVSDFKEPLLTQDWIENRSEIEALKKNIQSINAQIKGEKGNFLPKVDASMNFSKFGDNENLNGRDNYPNNQQIGTIQASWNLFNGNANLNEIKRLLFTKKQYLSKLGKLKLDINLQFETARLDLDVARKNFQTSKLGLQQAKENYKIVENRFNEGVSSTTDLIDANYLLSRAQQKYYKSYYNKFISQVRLLRILELN